MLFRSFLIAILITGLNSDTSCLNKDVAVKVAATLTTEVTAAAVTISAFGTGICISVPGTVIVVASPNCGRSGNNFCAEGVVPGSWYCDCGISSSGTFMGGTEGSKGFFF